MGWKVALEADPIQCSGSRCLLDQHFRILAARSFEADLLAVQEDGIRSTGLQLTAVFAVARLDLPEHKGSLGFRKTAAAAAADTVTESSGDEGERWKQVVWST